MLATRAANAPARAAVAGMRRNRHERGGGVAAVAVDAGVDGEDAQGSAAAVAVRDPGPPARHPLERPLWATGIVANAAAVVRAAPGLAGLDRLPASWSSGPWDELLASLLVAVPIWPAYPVARMRMDEARALASSLPLAPGSGIGDFVDDVSHRLGSRRSPALRLLAADPAGRQPTIVAWGDAPLLVGRLLVDALWPTHPQIPAFVVPQRC